MYVPPEGKLIRDIESSWILLEKAEHDRELALREELVRCVRLMTIHLACRVLGLCIIMVHAASVSLHAGLGTCCRLISRRHKY